MKMLAPAGCTFILSYFLSCGFNPLKMLRPSVVTFSTKILSVKEEFGGQYYYDVETWTALQELHVGGGILPCNEGVCGYGAITTLSQEQLITPLDDIQNAPTSRTPFLDELFTSTTDGVSGGGINSPSLSSSPKAVFDGVKPSTNSETFTSPAFQHLTTSHTPYLNEVFTDSSTPHTSFLNDVTESKTTEETLTSSAELLSTNDVTSTPLFIQHFPTSHSSYLNEGLTDIPTSHTSLVNDDPELKTMEESLTSSGETFFTQVNSDPTPTLNTVLFTVFDGSESVTTNEFIHSTLFKVILSVSMGVLIALLLLFIYVNRYQFRKVFSRKKAYVLPSLRVIRCSDGGGVQRLEETDINETIPKQIVTPKKKIKSIHPKKKMSPVSDPPQTVPVCPNFIDPESPKTDGELPCPPVGLLTPAMSFDPIISGQPIPSTSTPFQTIENMNTLFQHDGSYLNISDPRNILQEVLNTPECNEHQNSDDHVSITESITLSMSGSESDVTIDPTTE